MSAPNVTQQQSTTSSPPASTDPATGTPSAPTQQQPWRQPAGPGVPAWAVGKTTEEILAYGEQQRNAAQTWQGTAERIASQFTPPPGQQSPQGQQQQQQVDPNDYLTMGQFQQMAQQYGQQIQAPAMEAIGQMAWREALKDAPEIAQHYLAEATEFWAKMPPAQRNLEGARTVINLVRGNHFKELLALQTPAQAGDETFRSSGGPAPGSNGRPAGPGTGMAYNLFEDPKVPDEWKRKAKDRDITQDTIWEFCKANNITPEQYAQKYLYRSVGG